MIDTKDSLIATLQMLVAAQRKLIESLDLELGELHARSRLSENVMDDETGRNRWDA